MIQVVPAQFEPRRAHTAGGHTSDVISTAIKITITSVTDVISKVGLGRVPCFWGSDAGFQDCSFLEDSHEDDRTLLLCAYLKR